MGEKPDKLSAAIAALSPQEIARAMWRAHDHVELDRAIREGLVEFSEIEGKPLDQTIALIHSRLAVRQAVAAERASPLHAMPQGHKLSTSQIEAAETIFCIGGQTRDLLERAGSDRTAYDEVEAALRMAMQDAAFVSSSLETADSMRHAMTQEPTEAYYLARRAVEGCRLLGAKSSRDCVEMFISRRLEDYEWDGSDLRPMRNQFERAWNDQTPFSSPTLEWLKGQISRQYLLHLRRVYRGG